MIVPEFCIDGCANKKFYLDKIMTTALAAQLAQNASKNAELLIARSRNVFPVTESYLFSSKDARQHDFDSVLALAQNGVAQLELLSPGIFGKSAWLFESHSRDYDRTSVPAKEIKRLNAAIKDTLSAISPFLMEAASSKVIEWLVRRFRCVSRRPWGTSFDTA